jgi:hypothetical protein
MLLAMIVSNNAGALNLYTGRFLAKNSITVNKQLYIMAGKLLNMLHAMSFVIKF